ncbi:NUDIX domain-containing protein [Naumannella halotolerans]|uniref:ADP-ribose pyrophosphatase YjhB (NUDIX family) n=1 Tax=Naumannella halotolerans TaxID=993414 RepID=A0A4R7J0W1_9ACTN|nr:NUDIX domain-containing protein [Naumannella halotolerans]TDT30026.1 ADP-ribose pyrophosphatase YjhB (NUDIX family) [Naumannella halotolerans]
MPVPEFIRDLRRKIGHDLLWLPGVTAVVLRDHQVLLVRRADNLAWTLVTGIVEPGENPAEVAVREVWEEARVRCRIEALVRVAAGAPMVHANGDHAQYLDHTFECRYLDGQAEVGDDESVEVGWFDLDALPDLGPEQHERLQAVLDHTGAVRFG